LDKTAGVNPIKEKGKKRKEKERKGKRENR